MRQILWFRRDLRLEDNAILACAKHEVLPIFIFDTDILDKLPKDDKRVSFIYTLVCKLKKDLQACGLNLAVFYGKPKEIFKTLAKDFDEVLCSIDFDSYAINRDKEIAKILPMKKYLDSFITSPVQHLKKDGTAYKVFTPYYKSMSILTNSLKIQTYKRNKDIKLVDYSFENIIKLEEMGFIKQKLPTFLYEDIKKLLEDFKAKIANYEKNRDYFYLDATSKFSVHLRFGAISPRQLFNYYRKVSNSEFFIRELFWREFYNYILFHFPNSQTKNFNGLEIKWNENEEDFIKWCEGNTGVPIIDAAMRYLNKTGLIHNRLRMVVASFLTKNLFIDWKKGEGYFALKLLDYEASSNIGSWQWAASTGADAAPYFRIFNPYTQSQKFDKDAIFIKSVLEDLKDIPAKSFHVENGVSSNLFVNYPKSMLDISLSRKSAIEKFKRAKNE